MRYQVLAAAIVGGAFLGMLMYCSPSNNNNTDSDAGARPVCDDAGGPGCDCNPSKDNKPVDCYQGPPGTNGKGICKIGQKSCLPEGYWSECVGQVLPQPETCNYADDDCNGIVDDLPDFAADAGVMSYCTSPACDPDFTDASITCYTGEPGICGAGRKVCAGGPTGGTPTGCKGFIKQGAPEVCNGIDDDCNGSVDDGLDNEGPCTVDAGSYWPDGSVGLDGGPLKGQIKGGCLQSTLHCVDGGDMCPPSDPAVETCDGIDNDCNGTIDEHSCANNIYGDYYCCPAEKYCEYSAYYNDCFLAQ